MEKHGFFDIPNLIPITNSMVSKVKPKLDTSSDQNSVGVINSGDVEIELIKPSRLRKKKKSRKVKRKLKNKGKAKDKK